MKKCRFIISLVISYTMVTTATANTLYPPKTFFYNKALITTNVDICKASQGKYVYKLTQQWIDFPNGNKWTVCYDNNAELNYGQKFVLYFDIAQNDGSFDTVKSCEIVFTNTGELYKANRIVTLTNNGEKVDSCYVYLS